MAGRGKRVNARAYAPRALGKFRRTILYFGARPMRLFTWPNTDHALIHPTQRSRGSANNVI